jgi:hypothetical protein
MGEKTYTRDLGDDAWFKTIRFKITMTKNVSKKTTRRYKFSAEVKKDKNGYFAFCLERNERSLSCFSQSQSIS